MRRILIPALVPLLAALAQAPDLAAQPQTRSNEDASAVRRPLPHVPAKPQPPAATPPSVATPPPPVPGLADPKIADAIVTMHQIDVERSTLATKKAASPEVKRFADQLVSSHTAKQRSLRDLVARLGIRMESSDEAKGLRNEAAATLAGLRGLAGWQFDKAYVDAEAAYHEKLLRMIDAQLLPRPQSAPVKGALQDTRSSVAELAQSARQLQSLMTGAK